MHTIRAPKMKEVRLVAEQLQRAWRQIDAGPMNSALVNGDIILRSVTPQHVIAAMSHPSFSESVIEMHALVRWAQFGFPVFKLTHSLTALLAMTDCRGLRGADVRWPFDTFFVTLPDEFFSYSGFGGRVVQVPYIMVHRYGVAPRIEGLRPNDIIDKIECGELPETFLSQERAMHIACAGADGSKMHRTLPELGDDEPVDKFIYDYTHEENPSKIDEGLTYTQHDGYTMQAVARLLVNVTLHLRDMNAQGTWSPNAPSNIHKKGGKEKLWILGRDLAVDKNIINIARTRLSAESEDAKTLWRVRSRFVVRGHWRRQACGKGLQTRRLKWIAPFWKGPKDGEILSRTYTLGGER